MLMWLYSVIPGNDFGVAVILFTIFVRIVLYPLVKRQLHQARAMRKLQPQLKKLKKQADGDKQQEARLMMELYKRHGVSPFRSIGILLLQLPIFIGLFYVIRIFTEQREKIEAFTYNFLEHIPAIQAIIAHPKEFNETLFGVIDLTKPAIGSGGIDLILVALALTAAGTQYIMSKQTMPHQESDKRLRDIMAEAAEGKQADQAEMNAIVMRKMIKVLPIFMFFIMVSFPGALALYWGVSNIVAVIQQSYILRQDEEELEEIADEEPVKKSKKKTANTPVASRTTQSAKSREKSAKKANITRISAKDTRRK